MPMSLTSTSGRRCDRRDRTPPSPTPPPRPARRAAAAARASTLRESASSSTIRMCTPLRCSSCSIGSFGGQAARPARRQLRGASPGVPRQPQAERRALAFPAALDADRAAVQLDEVPHDRHAETEAAVTAAHRAVGLAEPIEHERQEFRRDADAGIGHFDLRRRRRRSVSAIVDAAALRRELERVRHQVPHHLLQPIAIAEHVDARRSSLRVTWIALAAAAGISESIASSITRLTGRPSCVSSTSRPPTMRDTSRMSSISCACDGGVLADHGRPRAAPCRDRGCSGRARAPSP